VVRGGSWNNNEDNCRSSNRNRNNTSNTYNNNGFRCCLVPLACLSSVDEGSPKRAPGSPDLCPAVQAWAQIERSFGGASSFRANVPPGRFFAWHALALFSKLFSSCLLVHRGETYSAPVVCDAWLLLALRGLSLRAFEEEEVLRLC